MDILGILKRALLSAWNEIGFKLIAAFLILAAGLKLAGFVSRKIAAGRGFRHLDESVQTFLKSALKVLLYVLVIFTAAYALGIPMTSFITLLASAGVAIGLALQGALSNFAGGLMILIFKPFEVGDFVEASGFSGTVDAITVFYTVLITPDLKRVTLPNGNLTGEAVVNFSSEKTRRFDIDIDIAYSENIDTVREIMESTALMDERALTEPSPPTVHIDELSESAMKFVLRVYCRQEDYWQLKWDLTENVRKALFAEGIEIPYRQIDVHMKN